LKNKLFARRLREKRAVAGLSLQDLAELTGLTKTGLHMLENSARQPSLATAAAIADALDCKIDELVEPLTGK